MNREDINQFIKKESVTDVFIACIASLSVVYLFGLCGLSFFVQGKALFKLGLFMFLPGAVFKVILLLGVYFGIIKKRCKYEC